MCLCFYFAIYDFDNLVHLYMMGLLTNNDVQLMFCCFNFIVVFSFFPLFHFSLWSDDFLKWYALPCGWQGICMKYMLQLLEANSC